MSFARYNNSAAGTAINNGIRDPLQGFDADIWVVDQATGAQSLIGRFTSIQLTIRNATEPYMEFNQRIPRMLDGEFQFGWVLERGLIDTRIIEETFGFSTLQREMRISRSPRFMITFDLNAPELHEDSGGRGSTNNINTSQNALAMNRQEIIANPGGMQPARMYRKAVGQYRLTYCKVDSLTIGAMAGRSVIATRWEGMAEGITYFQDSDVWAGTVLREATTPETSGDSIDRRRLEPTFNGAPFWARIGNNSWLEPTSTGNTGTV